MRISISLKWTVSAVVIVILVICVYAFFMLRDVQTSVENETARIEHIQLQALDEIGSQTTRYISLPASSLLYDNDKSGLTNLLSPVVENKDENNRYFAIYSTIIDPNGRVWVAAVHKEYETLKMSGARFFDRGREEPVIDEVPSNWMKNEIKSKQLPATDNVEREVKVKDGSTKTLNIRQYTHAIEGNGEVQGYLLIGYSIDGLTEEIDAIKAQGEVRKDEAISRAIWLALIAIIVGLVIAGVQAVLVTRNIKKLTKTANQIASGDLSVRSDVHSHDEIGQLGEQFNVMADRVQILMDQTEKDAMKKKELDIACSIQKTLLPPDGHARCGFVDLNGYFQPASECGGDFWSYNLLPDGSVLLTIGDVTGHGVPSAMITACAKSALDTMLNLTTSQGINLPQMMASLNAAICQAAKRTLFMTFLAVRITRDGRTAEIVNAGHNFPLLIHDGKVQGAVARGERLGDNDRATYEMSHVALVPGDMLLLFTDGLIEYANEQNAEYGEKRLRKVIAPLGAAGVDDAMSSLWADFQSFCGNAPQNDDITLMFARV